MQGNELVCEQRQARSTGLQYGVASATGMLLTMIAGRLWVGVLTPIELAAEWLIPKLPIGLFEAGLGMFGGYAKPILYVVALVLTLALGGLIGAGYEAMLRRTLARPEKIAAGFTVVLVLLTGVVYLPAFGQGFFGAAATTGGGTTMAVYAVAYVVFGALLTVHSLLSDARGPLGEHNPSRRRFLRRGLVVGRGVLLLAVGAPIVARLLDSVSMTNLSLAEGMPAAFTPVGTFYNVSKNIVDPRVEAATWKLRVSGLVEEPFELTLDQLRALPSETKPHTLQCISNPVGGNLIGNGEWVGVPLAALLDRAKIRPGVVDIKLTSEDGYTDSIPLVKALESGTLLAYELNGEPLTYKHGAPLRLLVPDIYGMKNAKWITSIEAVAEDFKGYWQRQGWDDVATYQIVSQIRVPAANTALTVGAPLMVEGLAFAGHRGIETVEYTADGGRTWRQADLLPEIGDDCWRFWRASWTPNAAGAVRLSVRATDGAGASQKQAEAPPSPSGATGYHDIVVEVREAGA
ncbi:MAG: molybdopterin-dependent oxidoreductase [Chloroflexia bacterium]|nr:molybdopterin-dependent oxidoreductase [Chloroflexia bacterium]